MLPSYEAAVETSGWPSRILPIVDIRLLETPEDLASYDAWLRGHPEGTLWQSLSWKDYQEALGRKTRIYAAIKNETILGSALVITDRTTGGFSAWDIPRGPVGEHREELIRRIEQDAKTAKCLVLYRSPLSALESDGWTASPRHEQPEASRILTLSDDNALLAQMKPKGRYNIGVAQRYALEVRECNDVAAFHALLKKTGGRDGFQIGPEKRYKAFLEHLPGAFLLLCYHTSASDTEPVAGLIGLTWPDDEKSRDEAAGLAGPAAEIAPLGERMVLGRKTGGLPSKIGIYYYGASSYEHRALMAPYLLQWEAMRRCRELGCTRYDLLGVAPPDAGDDHPWAGISSFKEKFGGEMIVYPKEQQLVLKPWLLRALEMKRKILG